MASPSLAHVPECEVLGEKGTLPGACQANTVSYSPVSPRDWGGWAGPQEILPSLLHLQARSSSGGFIPPYLTLPVRL